MVFQEVGGVPLWMTPQERVATKFSQYDEPQLKDNTKAELLGNLKSSGVYISLLKGKSVDEMQEISHKIISVTKRTRKGGVKGYMGNPEGILKVLWEHVFMDTYTDVCTYYGNTIIETVLREIKCNCLNFIEEDTLLKTNA